TIEGVLIKDSDITIPTANYVYFNVGQTTRMYDDGGVLNVTLIIDGIDNETNSSGINNSYYIFIVHILMKYEKINFKL
ncbi:hypothetical protein LCGC14_1749570, partial [marine sediment metagenome]